MNSLVTITNATKAQIVVVINAFFALLTAFNVELSDTKEGAIIVFVNALLGLWIALTYKLSSKRVSK